MDLPIYSDAMSGGAKRFEALDRVRGLDLSSCFDRFDSLLDHGEGVRNVPRARAAMREPGKKGLLAIHSALFEGQSGAGQLRGSTVAALFKGQDCPEPQFIERSLDNFAPWLSADSFEEIHPVEQAALVLTRLIDIWPFEFGNRTATVVFANFFLVRVGYPPFFVLPDQFGQFEQALSEAIRMQTQPLVGAIYKSILREVDLVAK